MPKSGTTRWAGRECFFIICHRPYADQPTAVSAPSQPVFGQHLPRPCQRPAVTLCLFAQPGLACKARKMNFGSLGDMRPPRSEPEAFVSRRVRAARRFAESGIESAAFASGWARPRNFAHNVYPFRAESHFLWFVGEHLEGAVLVFQRGAWTLFATEPDAEMELWDGPATSLSEWEQRLSLRVISMKHFETQQPACLPPQDDETATWLAALLKREVLAQSGPHLKDADALLASCMVDERLVTDAPARAQLRYAARLSAQAHVAGMTVTARCDSESQVRACMEQVIAAAGAHSAYGSIVTTQGQILHASKSPYPLRPGELLLCDVGAESPEGFAGDVTRTWPTSGRFSPTQRLVYELVLDVQNEALAQVVVGQNYIELHLAALRGMTEGLLQLGLLRGGLEQCLEAGAANVFFPHGLGHLVGLDVHDMEDLGDRAGFGEEAGRKKQEAMPCLRLGRTLRNHMVVTIEPGFYQIPLLLKRASKDAALSALIDFERLEQFSDVRGIRIEDDVLVTESGPEVLSLAAPKAVADVERVLAGG